MRTLGVVTTSRADFGIYTPILRRVQESSKLELELYVTGMHLSPEFGLTVRDIEAAGFPISERVEMLLSSDTPQGISRSMANGITGFAQVFSRSRPDLLLVLGDRFEMHAAAVAALPFGIPMAHVHGGEVTSGAIDEALRHGITKMSHLHFVSTEAYARRVIQLGEEPWRVTVSGAPMLDAIAELEPMPRSELGTSLGVDLSVPPLLVTFHPATLEYERAGTQTEALLAALEEVRIPVIFTMPNADTGGRVVRDKINAFVERNEQASSFETLGAPRYLSLMRCAAAMVGNSSSGLLEAASFELPVVNIGNRQAGRVRGANVIDVDAERRDIVAGIETALDPEFRTSLSGLENPYRQQDDAARIIVNRLVEVPLDERLTTKLFHDLDEADHD